MKDILHESVWSDTKGALSEGLSGTKKKNFEILLENQRKALMENAPLGATSSAHIASINKMILPVIRRVMPTTIANEIVAVQPMTGPIGQINTLRLRYAETFGSPNPVTAGTEALSPFDIARFYAGNGNSTTPAAAPTISMEGVRGKALNMQIVKETVEAKSMRLSASWTFEAAQDAQNQYAIDMESETIAALSQELLTEIDQGILLSLRRLPGTPTVTYDQSAVSGVATFVGDEHAALATLIGQQANRVAQRTRRQAANWAVVSPAALTVLQSARTSSFARTTEGTFDAPSNTQFAGTLNGTMKIFVDTYASDTEVILLGLKMSETEAPAYYCPYIPLMSTGVIMDPNTLMPVTGLMTRFGYLELTNSVNSFGNAADYTAAIGVSNLRFY